MEKLEDIKKGIIAAQEHLIKMHARQWPKSGIKARRCLWETRKLMKELEAETMETMKSIREKKRKLKKGII